MKLMVMMMMMVMTMRTMMMMMIVVVVSALVSGWCCEHARCDVDHRLRQAGGPQAAADSGQRPRHPAVRTVVREKVGDKG